MTTELPAAVIYAITLAIDSAVQAERDAIEKMVREYAANLRAREALSRSKSPAYADLLQFSATTAEVIGGVISARGKKGTPP